MVHDGLPIRPEPQKRPFARRHCCGFGIHAAEIQSVVPGRVYLIVAVCRPGQNGYPDDLVVRAIAEANGLEKYLVSGKPAVSEDSIDKNTYDPIEE